MTADVRPATRRATYRPFVVEVARRRVLGAHFVRLTFVGADLDHCGDTGLDQRVKLVFADPGQLAHIERHGVDAEFDWYAWWLGLDDRPAMRTYTLRAIRPADREVDIDFACHGTAGPASRFALAARPGDRLVLVGPDAEVPESAEQGLAWRPGSATQVMLAGDETAVPAICGIVESLTADVVGEVFCEVPSADDLLDVAAPAGVRVTWLVRGEAPVGSTLQTAVSAWVARRTGTAAGRSTGEVDRRDDASTDPDDLLWDEAAGVGTDGLYVWLAGEAGAITRLRRSLVEAGLDRTAMSFMGYWKDGVAATG